MTEAPEGITPPTEWFTVEGLFDVVRENLDADKIEVRYDGVQGYPTSIDNPARRRQTTTCSDSTAWRTAEICRVMAD
ncbi:MAG TPA: DUF6174 domain-containing protein [Acidimicrobiia bacterium]|nr:DUF6174 domain-containing protein [Acidimicrobiia bacterium]